MDSPADTIVLRFPRNGETVRAGAFVFFAVIALTFALTAGSLKGSQANANIFVGGLMAALILAGFAVWYALTQVTLAGDGITVERPRFHRMLLRIQIAGMRVSTNNHTLRIFPTDTTLKPITLPRAVLDRAAVARWFDGIPDLDRQENEARARGYEDDSRYGATPEERRARIAFFRKIGGWAVSSSVVLGVWLLLYPHPFPVAMAVAVALPLIAMALAFWSDGLLSFSYSDKTDPRTSLAVVLVMAGIGLVIRAGTGLHILDWQTALEWAAAGAVAILGVLTLLSAFTGAPPIAIVFLGAAALAYSYGVVVLADVYLDPSAPGIYRATVIERYTSHSRSGTLYHLNLTSRGPVRGEDDVEVPEPLYDAVQPGSIVCVPVHAGRLGMRWYRVEAC